jgi:hypothetical protein
MTGQETNRSTTLVFDKETELPIVEAVCTMGWRIQRTSDHRSNSAPQERCLGCGYILEHLPENRCPECRRAFDPNDPRTFTAGAPSLFPAPSGTTLLVWACIGSLLALFGFVVVFLVFTLDLPAHVLESPVVILSSCGLPVGLLIDIIVALTVSRARRRGRYSHAHKVAGWIAAAPLAVISLLFILAILQNLIAWIANSW